MHRSEYMAYRETELERATAHRQYYAQYVTPGIRELVRRYIGEPQLRASEDRSFNDIPLRQWDRLAPNLYVTSIAEAMKANGDLMTLSAAVCMLKEAARQIVEGK